MYCVYGGKNVDSLAKIYGTHTAMRSVAPFNSRMDQ